MMDRRDELRTLLAVEGVTTAKVGEKIGITGQAISAMNVGKSRVSEEALCGARACACEVLSAGLTTLGHCLAAEVPEIEADGQSECEKTNA